MKNKLKENLINQKNFFIKKFFASRLEPRNYNLEANSGHTLIEILVVIAIATAMMGISMYNYYTHRKNDLLMAETQKIAQMLRRSQNLALSPQLGGEIVNGFGLNISTTLTGGVITIFKDIGLTPNYIYDGGAEKIEELNLDLNVMISVLQAPPINGDNTTADETAFNILYIPPDPVVKIYNASANTGESRAKIVVALTDGSKSRSIEFNLTGLVEIK